jgi:acyl-CoA synthetase (AMP-forming)/AMP-acid ligase II
MSPRRRPANLVELLEHRAEVDGDRVAFTFLADGSPPEELTYGQLRRRVVSTARLLRACVPAGGRALLLYPAGLDFIVAFLACAYAGVVAVPVPSPGRSRSRLLEGVHAVASDCAPHALAATGEVLAGIPELRSRPLDRMVVLATDGRHEEDGAAWLPGEVGPGSLALLQYTSGSSHSKGVMLSHANLIANLRAVQEATGQGRDSVAVSWLPHFHDMGLGGMLGSLYGGFPTFLMSPLAFLERPVRWLRAVTAHRATWTGGPNFAFDLCVRRVRQADIEALDLSSLEVVANGSEPVRADTIRRFTDAFAPAGLRPESMTPCYGLAECVVFVSGGRRESRPRVVRLSSAELRSLAVVRTDEPPPVGQDLVGCGAPSPWHRVRIVDPDLAQPCRDGRVGEIWVGGQSVAGGYWNRPRETEEAFGAYLGAEGPFLRTGDLGILWEGELFVVGRLKDLIIVGGVNHYPQDIERTVEASHPTLRLAASAAFSVDAGGERLVVVAEARPWSHPAEVLSAVRAAVAEAHGIALHGIALLPARTLPKTSSGKVRRQAARAAWLSGQLQAWFRWESPGLEDRGDREVRLAVEGGTGGPDART